MIQHCWLGFESVDVMTVWFDDSASLKYVSRS